MKGLSTTRKNDDGNDDDEGTPEEKHVGWYDLFFDLCLVTVIARLSEIVVETFSASVPEEHDHESEFEGENFFGCSNNVHALLIIFTCGWISYRAWTFETMQQMRRVAGDDLIERSLGFFFLVSLCMFSSSIGQVASGKYPTKSKHLGDYFLAWGGFALLFPILKSIRLGMNAPKYMDMIRYLIPLNIGAVLTYICVGFTNVKPGTKIVVYFVVEVTLISLNFYVSCRARAHVHPEYMNERVGVLVIVMLGEMVASIVASSTGVAGPGWEKFSGCVCGVVAVYGIWWLYFDTVPNPEVFNHSTRTSFSWFVHFVLFVSLATASGSLRVLLTRLDGGDGQKDINDDLSVFSLASFACAILSIKTLGLIYRWSGHNSLELMASFFRVIFALSICTLVTVLLHDNFDAQCLVISMAFHSSFFVLEGLFWDRSDVGKKWMRVITAMKKCKAASLSRRAPLLVAPRRTSSLDTTSSKEEKEERQASAVVHGESA